MATEAVFDLAQLLQPFSDDKPAGEDIRADFSPTSMYYQIKDARAAARTAERQNLMSEDPDAIHQKVSEWDKILELAPKALVENGKDLEVAAWYVEALIREFGFPGLRDGLCLLNGLIEKYWDGLYPLPDEDGLETRVSPLIGLNGVDGDGTLIGPIKQVSLTCGFTNGGYAAWQYEQAYEIEVLADPEKKQARIASGAVTLSMIEDAVAETPTDFFMTLIEDVGACIDEFAKLSAALEEKCGHEAPASSNIRKALNRVNEIVGFLTKDLVLSEPDAVNEARGDSEGNAVAAKASVASKSVSIESININTRDEAFRTLLKVSEFFKRTEPHSPISYNLNQAVKWGRMPLPELLAELIPDDRAREEYFKLAGIPKSEGSD
ncbi:MAG TPA: type VI secretion system protein TssA [Gammaproteobacteria bacterium]|nr:type VI secretion system protein TssA [Gammaproteobacteria bacterium]